MMTRSAAPRAVAPRSSHALRVLELACWRSARAARACACSAPRCVCAKAHRH
jgi:hypothetical protein